MIDIAARAASSEMTEGRERDRPVIGVTPFDWSRDYRTTFDACPSAFWLAPDAADTLPAADLLTPRPAAPKSDAAPAPQGWRVRDRAIGSAVAIVVAGPVFAAIGLLAMNPGLRGLGHAATSLMAFPLTVMVGVLLSVVPITIGSFVMGRWGEHSAVARRLSAWAGAGALSGGLLGGLFGQTPLSVAIMAATGAACAAIARWKVCWSPGDHAFPESTRTPAVAISA